jgi:hypothetical protein
MGHPVFPLILSFSCKGRRNAVSAGMPRSLSPGGRGYSDLKIERHSCPFPPVDKVDTYLPWSEGLCSW